MRNWDMEDWPQVEHEDPIEEQDLWEEFSTRGISFDFNVASCSENTEKYCGQNLQWGEQKEAERPEKEAAEQFVTLQQADSALQTLKIFFLQEQFPELFLHNLLAMEDNIQKKRLQELKQRPTFFADPVSGCF